MTSPHTGGRVAFGCLGTASFLDTASGALLGINPLVGLGRDGDPRVHTVPAGHMLVKCQRIFPRAPTNIRPLVHTLG